MTIAQAVVTTRNESWQRVPATPGTIADVNLCLTDDRDQNWEGWGGCFNELGWIALSKVTDAQRDEVLRALFDPEQGPTDTQRVARETNHAN